MSYTVDGSEIVTGIVECPYVGAWWADLKVNGEPPTGAVTLDLGGASWSGFVASSRLDGGIGMMRVIGGAGGLSNSTSARWYRGGSVMAQTVADTIAMPGAETVGVVDGTLATYQVFGASVGMEFERLATTLGRRFYVDMAGVVQISSENPETPDLGILQETRTNYYEYASPTFEALAGITVQGETVRHVRHMVSKGGSKSLYFVKDAVQGPALNRVERAPRKGKLTGQSGNTCSVQLDDGWALNDIPLYGGVPGMSVEAAVDSEVVVLYLSDDPRKPVAMLTPLDGPSPSSLTFNHGGSVTFQGSGVPTPVIKVGDIITVTGMAPGALTISSVSNPVNGHPSELETT